MKIQQLVALKFLFLLSSETVYLELLQLATSLVKKLNTSSEA